jgi:hypothetical protein
VRSPRRFAPRDDGGAIPADEDWSPFFNDVTAHARC